MKKTQLAELIRKIIQEELSIMDEESQAAKDAKAQGLTSMGFGRWGKDGKVTHKTDRGRLTPVQSDKDVGLRPGTTTATKNKFYRAMPSRGARGMDTRPAAIKGPDGKLKRAEPKWTPDVNRERNKPQDTLDSGPQTILNVNKGTSAVERRLVNKVSQMFDTVWEKGEMDQHYGKSMPSKEFEKLTGISPKAAKVFTRVVNDYETPFLYDETDDTVYVSDPMDV